MTWSLKRWSTGVLAGVLGLGIVAFAQSSDKIDVSKMNPPGLLVDKYSYMAQPYSCLLYTSPSPRD